MTQSVRRSLFFFLFCAVIACDQTVDKGDDKLTEGRQQIEVIYKNSIQTVYFDNLETKYPIDKETPVVFVDDIVLGSGLVTKTDGIWLNFVGEDDFTPIGVCPEQYAPTPGDFADQGYIERGTTRLIWDEALQFERCMSVKDVVTIEIADDPGDLPIDPNSKPDIDPPKPSDEGVPFEHVAVHFQEESISVASNGLPTAVIKGKTVLLVSTILEAAGIESPYDKYTLDFEGSDGYRPSEKGTCEDYLPAPGSIADQAGINLETSELLWHETLYIEKCAFVKLVAHIYVESE